MERERQLPRRLAPGLITLVGGLFFGAGLVAGCVADEDVTASLADSAKGEQVLPSVTTTTSEASRSEPSESTNDDTTTITGPTEPLVGLDAELIVDGFDQPIFVTGAPGTEALFVVEREGVVWAVEGGQRGAEPFLDLTDRLLSSSIEQGLLGLAFHPDYDTNGRLFAYWTDPEGDSVLAQFTTEGANPPELSTMEVIFTVDQPAERHNAGMIAFGPDGLLYLALGDGGSGGGPAQDISNPLGSIVRLDIDAGSPYGVPPGNPFEDEIWVYGLRNPWRFSIDPVSELVYIGDVGQDSAEEINVVALTGGGTNFGWAQAEGDACFRSDCDLASFTGPVLQYGHDQGCSVTGGLVYRGAAIPEMVGHYFFADWCGGLVASFRYDDGRVLDQLDWSEDLAELAQVTSFGQDASGELLVVNWDGQLFRIVPVR